MSSSKHRLIAKDRSTLPAHHRRPCETPRRTAAAAADFDADAWVAVVEAQRLAVARAAGVDPSKVRFQIGH